MLIYIIEDDPDWQNLYRNLFGGTNRSTSKRLASRTGESQSLPRRSRPIGPAKQISTHFFSDGVTAMDAIDGRPPDAIILDMLLAGPSAPSLLAELQSYSDTAAIPVILITGVEISSDLSPYGVVKVFNKATMQPQELLEWIQKLAP